MSKNMLDPIVRALVGVPEDRLGLVLDVVNRLGNENTGDMYRSNLAIFNRNGGRVVVGDLKIVPAPLDPVKFIGEGWGTLPKEHDSRNDGLTEVDFSKVDFLHCLKDGEEVITGEEKLKRLKASGQLRYGAATFMGLWNDYQSRKENSVLETLYRTKGITYLDFFGDILLNPFGNRFVLYLRRFGDGQWSWHYGWLYNGWGRSHGSAVSQVNPQN